MLNGNGKLYLSKECGSGGITFMSIGDTLVGAFGITDYTRHKIAFGNGTTPATENDYHMESEINSLTVLNFNIASVSNYTDNFIKNLQCTVRNNTNETITVSELAWITCPQNNWSVYVVVMMDHEVFEPVPIAPGETYTFGLTIG